METKDSRFASYNSEVRSKKSIKILVNGRKFVLTKNVRSVSYAFICRLAGKESTGEWEVDYSTPGSAGGSLIMGEAVIPVDGMVFYVTITDNS